MSKYLLLILVLIQLGCGKETSVVFLELNISDSYLSSDHFGIALLSDSEGKVFDHKSFDNGDRIQLSIDFKKNKSIHLTLIKLGNLKNDSHEITTFKNVKSGQFFINSKIDKKSDEKIFILDNRNSIYSVVSTSAGIQFLNSRINNIEAGINDDFVILTTDIYRICDFGPPCISKYSILPINNNDTLVTAGLIPITFDTIFPIHSDLVSIGTINAITSSDADLCNSRYFEIPQKTQFQNYFFLDWSDYFDAFEIEYVIGQDNINHRITELTDNIPSQLSPILPHYTVLKKDHGTVQFDFDTPYTYYLASYQFIHPTLKRISWKIIGDEQISFILPNLDNISNTSYINDKKNQLTFRHLEVFTYSSYDNYEDYLLKNHYQSSCNRLSLKYHEIGDFVIHSTLQ